MRLNEIMFLGDDNVLGQLFDQATTNLKKFQKSNHKETRSIASGLLDILNRLQATPTVLHGDGYSAMRYLQMLANPKVEIQTIRMVSDALGSYEDDSGE